MLLRVINIMSEVTGINRWLSTRIALCYAFGNASNVKVVIKCGRLEISSIVSQRVIIAIR